MKKSFKKRFFYNPLGRSPLKTEKKGVALILALTSLMFMVYIASEVTRDSSVEYIVNSQELNRIKAYYAARNGMQIALLRVKIFQQVSRANLPPGFSKQIDQIWKFPFAWPLPVMPDVNAVDKENIAKLNKESFMDATYTHTIEDEGSKIDINDLGSPSKALQEITKKQILNIFEQKIEADEKFRQEYQNVRFDELVGHITDWMSDSSTAAAGGGDKKSYFAELGQNYPPNRGFRTVDELRLVPGITEEFFDLMLPRITIYGMKAINPNTAPADVLKSLDPSMTDKVVSAVIGRRDNPDLGGPFEGEGKKCLEAFKSFIQSEGLNRLAEDFDKIPMICDKVINFRIKSTGLYGGGKGTLIKNITAVVLDLGRSAQQIKTYIDEENKQQQPPPGQPPPTGATPPAGNKSSPTEPLPKGPPRVVYWSEY